jgi:diguanylate cyclase (GGDEF)-like protein/PAS domain S-box-containing protein
MFYQVLPKNKDKYELFAEKVLSAAPGSDSSREFFHAVFYAISDGIVAIDAIGRIVAMNNVAVSMTEWREANAVGKPIDEVFPFKDEETQERLTNIALLALQDRVVVRSNENAVLIAHSGREIAVSASAVPVFGRKGNLIGAALIFQDEGRARAENVVLRYASVAANAANRDLQEAYRRESQTSMTDDLTGIHNRRFLFRALEAAIDNARQTSLPFSAILFDVDRFKRLNDKYGHLAGDETLKAVALDAQSRLKAGDLFARYGGEEFVALLPRKGLRVAVRAAESIRKGIENLNINAEGAIFSTTISCGVTEFHADDTVDRFVRRADRALYVAKNGGRNRVVSIREQRRKERRA